MPYGDTKQDRRNLLYEIKYSSIGRLNHTIQFRVKVFELCNSVQRLCRLMNKVVPNEINYNVFVYLDDLLVISSDFDQHLKLLVEVANCMRNANLTIGIKIIVLFSQKLISHQRNYNVTYHVGVQKYRQYAISHERLQWLMNLKDLIGSLARQSLQLQTFRHFFPDRASEE